VLVLGAGYVSSPVVEYLTREQDVGVTLAAAIKEEANGIAANYERTEPVLLDVKERPDLLESLISDHDLVISLLPWDLHPMVADVAIGKGTDMVTASYLSPEVMHILRNDFFLPFTQMEKRHAAAVSAGVTVVNEVGADPGIDHLLAMQCFDEAHTGGGKVEKFISFCGGLPAPESSGNPLGYKFSWSPRGALLNMLAGAKYLENGSNVMIEPNGGLLEAARDMNFLPGFNLEGFPNRDSTKYGDLYGINEANTVLRGTLRYKGQ